MVEANPRDLVAWSTLARALFDIKEIDLCATTLDQFEKAIRPRPGVIDDLRGDIADAREEKENAEKSWIAFLKSNPPRSDAAATCDKLASLFVDESRWRDVLEFRTKAIAAAPTAERRVLRATALLRLRNWNEAFAEMHRASALEASDPTVEEWQPQFERLDKFLPKIKALDAQIAKNPGAAALLLDRARLFTLAERPLLALDDCNEALRIQPASIRARVQKGEALLDDNQAEEAARIGIATKLIRADDKHIAERALRELGANDALITANPKAAEPFAARAKVLRGLGQFTLALADARSSLAINDKLAAAHFEAAHALDELEDTKEALAHAIRASELDAGDPVKWYYRGVIEAKRANFAGAIESQTRSIGLRESLVALQARAEDARRVGEMERANADLQRIAQLAQDSR